MNHKNIEELNKRKRINRRNLLKGAAAAFVSPIIRHLSIIGGLAGAIVENKKSKASNYQYEKPFYIDAKNPLFLALIYYDFFQKSNRTIFDNPNFINKKFYTKEQIPDEDKRNELNKFLIFKYNIPGAIETQTELALTYLTKVSKETIGFVYNNLGAIETQNEFAPIYLKKITNKVAEFKYNNQGAVETQSVFAPIKIKNGEILYNNQGAIETQSVFALTEFNYYSNF